MILYGAGRLLGLMVKLLVSAALVFFVLDTLVGDPARVMLGLNATPDAVAALELQLGMDRPPVERFALWLRDLMVGNFGVSPTLSMPAAEPVAASLGVTLPLLATAALLAAGMGLGLGLLAARRKGTAIDRVLTGAAFGGLSVPGFWLGSLLLLVFAGWLKWLPPGGFVPWTENPAGAFTSLILPALALALPVAAALVLSVRAAMVAAQSSDYVLAARAAGMSDADAVWRLGLRNATAGVVAGLGPQLALLVAGAAVVETVFYLPGLGRLLLDAAATRDIVVMRSGLMVLLFVVALAQLAAELGRAWLDPRLRVRSEA